MHLLSLVAIVTAAQASQALEPSASLRSCQGYAVNKLTENSTSLTAHLDLIGKGCGVYGPDVPHLELVVEYQTDARLHVIIRDRKEHRYEIPEEVLPRPASSPVTTTSTSQLSFNVTKDPFSFQIIRKSDNETLFDTSLDALIFEKQYIHLKTRLPSDPNLYGLGEHTDTFRLQNKDYVRTLWNRDSAGVPHGQNLYGTHPIYFEHRVNGTHGVFLANSNGMDVKIDQDDKNRNYLEYNIIGGVLDFYFLAGPSPVEVAQQYAEVVGTPALVPYWSLGFHQCKYGYRDWFEVAEVVYNYSLANIPLETMWTDIDYMDRRRIFTLDEGNYPLEKVQQIVGYLQDRDQHYIVMIDPAVADYDYRPYNVGVEQGVFVKTQNGSAFRGVVWPGVTVFPDWFNPNTTDYWAERFQEFFDAKTGVDIDGVWIDMNEPASFCPWPCDDPYKLAHDGGLPPQNRGVRTPPRAIPGFPSSSSRESFNWPAPEIPEQKPLIGRDTLNGDRLLRVEVDHKDEDLLKPPYRIKNHVPSGELSDRTMYTDIQHANGLWTYDTHNLYGMMMSMATREAMLRRRPGLRPFIVTRSTFAGSGRSVAKWTGDNISTWDHYRASIAGILNFASIFQLPMVGADACGFQRTTNEKLCARWAALAAFSPFYRNHADDTSPNQEYYLWPLVTSAAQYAISIRYQLLDYFYTALARQAENGTPALNPLWYMYPQDNETFGIDLQYLYGDCLLVAPVTEEGSRDVKIYLPKGVWYEWGSRDSMKSKGEWIKLTNIPFDRIPLYVRGGCVLPLRTESAYTTTALRKKGFDLLVAPDLDGNASGELYLDDGVSLDGGPHKTHVTFSFKDGELGTFTSYGDEARINVEKVTVLGEKDPKEEL